MGHRDAGLLDCELSLGRIAGGSSPWEITLSTLPFREGNALFADSPERCRRLLEGARPDGRRLVGDIVECTSDFLW